MKIYELMSQLAECDAGAEVRIHTTKTITEIKNMPTMDQENGEDLKDINLDIIDVDQTGMVVYLCD